MSSQSRRQLIYYMSPWSIDQWMSVTFRCEVYCRLRMSDDWFISAIVAYLVFTRDCNLFTLCCQMLSHQLIYIFIFLSIIFIYYHLSVFYSIFRYIEIPQVLLRVFCMSFFEFSFLKISFLIRLRFWVL